MLFLYHDGKYVTQTGWDWSLFIWRLGALLKSLFHCFDFTTLILNVLMKMFMHFAIVTLVFVFVQMCLSTKGKTPNVKQL